MRRPLGGRRRSRSRSGRRRGRSRRRRRRPAPRSATQADRDGARLDVHAELAVDRVGLDAGESDGDQHEVGGEPASSPVARGRAAGRLRRSRQRPSVRPDRGDPPASPRNAVGSSCHSPLPPSPCAAWDRSTNGHSGHVGSGVRRAGGVGPCATSVTDRPPPAARSPGSRRWCRRRPGDHVLSGRRDPRRRADLPATCGCARSDTASPTRPHADRGRADRAAGAAARRWPAAPRRSGPPASCAGRRVPTSDPHSNAMPSASS